MRFLGLCSTLVLTLACPGVHLTAEQPRVKLIVQITMDQLRGDLLRDYVPALGKGFRRLESGGYWIRRGDVDHALTVSFPGHTTLATGLYPSHHGLTANEWWMERDGKWASVDVSDDQNFAILGSKGVGASPKNLLVSTLGEWVKQADQKSKSIALGTGDRIPIAYGGHHADGVYWYNTTANQFTTSTYYAAELADWVRAFNKDELPSFEKKRWTLTVPARFVRLANPKRVSFGVIQNRAFPHHFEDESHTAKGASVPYANWFSATPMKDEALFALATRAIDAEKLGQRGALDYIAIDVDSTDNIGHRYGPRSLEQLDTLVRLDNVLNRFLEHLDKTVGKGRYVVALAADHGVADPPELNPAGRRITITEIDAVLDKVEDIARNHQGSGDQLRNLILAELKQANFMADVYTEDRLSQPSDDPYLLLYQRCFRRGLTPDFPLWSNKDRKYHPARYGIIARFKEGIVFDAAVGVHGSPYAADRDVPLIFYGGSIRHGVSDGGGRTVDVAPTLSAAARLTPPDVLDGHVLSAVLGR